MSPEFVVNASMVHLPQVLRWSGAIAKRLRGYNIGLTGKSSGSALTDALTLADLTVQELIVAALRDADPIFRTCRIEAEEITGDLGRFATNSPLVIALDPIDGTKQYRDKTGNGYAVMYHVRSHETVHYSLVFIPEKGPHGHWLEVSPSQILSGPDNPSRPAEEVLRAMTPITADARETAKSIYLIGFQSRDRQAAAAVSQTGLVGVAPDDMPGSIYDLFATGQFAGSLIHSPNIYDYPVALHIARELGGNSVWVHNGEPVHFGETWMDDRADMLRLPGIVATAASLDVLAKLVSVAKNWNTERYHTGESL